MAVTIALGFSGAFSNRGRMAAGSITLDNHYDVGGYTILASDLGFTENIVHLSAIIPGLYTIFDASTQKLICYSGVKPHTHNLLLKNGAVADDPGSRVNAGGNLLGANTGGDLTVTGGGANGGVVAAGAAAAGEVAHTTNLAAYTGTFIAFAAG